MSKVKEASKPLSLDSLMGTIRLAADEAKVKRDEIDMEASEPFQRSWQFFNGKCVALNELESWLRLYLESFPMPPRVDLPNPGEVSIQLSNDAIVSIREGNSCLHIGEVDTNGEDTWVCTISPKGVLVAPNSSCGCEVLSKDLRDPAAKGELHDVICASHKGRPCDCPSAALGDKQ